MGAHVHHQVARLREGLAAGGTDVGAVAGMGADVHREVHRLRPPVGFVLLEILLITTPA